MSTYWVDSANCLALALCQQLEKGISIVTRSQLMQYNYECQQYFNNSDLNVIALNYFDKAISLWPEYFGIVKNPANSDDTYYSKVSKDELMYRFALNNIDVLKGMFEIKV